MPTWSEFQKRCFYDRNLNFAVDYSRVYVPDSFFSSMATATQRAFTAMSELEKGAIANPDEKRMVGHYWLRAPELAPTAEIRSEIEGTYARIVEFAAGVHSKKITNAHSEPFKHLLVVGIGGSALGPQFVSQALRSPNDPLDLYFFDNTDPDGMNRVVATIPDLSKTLCVVISKSGGTKETRNGQLVAKVAFAQRGLSVEKHFIAVTGDGSELDKTAQSERWLARFPMWDWVGGRTSEFSAVGLLPAALQGFPIAEILEGAKAMDVLTRVPSAHENPAMLLALMWYHIGKGKGLKDMVVLPYRDRIELFSRYLQQLVMESLGKEHDLDGKIVNQGIAVYGNKGSTDQHAYVQQLRDGLNNFFITFINVLNDGEAGGVATALEVEPGITSGDFLSGFYQGTRRALYEKDRESISITIPKADAHAIGMLIALFERAVGLYASLIHINAYHQPGVEAGKKAAGEVITVQMRIMELLKSRKDTMSVDAIAAALGMEAEAETIFHVVRALSANNRLRVEQGASLFTDRYAVA